jgi:type IV pilus assembly protein PilO
MDLSLNKVPWWGQLALFVIVCAGGVFAFWYFYASEMAINIAGRETRLAGIRAEIQRGVATARRLPEFQAQVNQLQQRLEGLRQILPEEKEAAKLLELLQQLAVQSNLTLQRITPDKVVQQPMYQEHPYKLQAEGTYHNLGYFFDRISKFPRIINVNKISIKAKTPPEPNATIVAECSATTFVLQEAPAAAAKPGAPKPPAK